VPALGQHGEEVVREYGIETKLVRRALGSGALWRRAD
jgi:hypothetical protein